MNHTIAVNHYRRAVILARLLDTQFQFFGFRFGLDPLIGLIPGIGDLVGVGLSLYILGIAAAFRVPQELYIRMIINVIIDYLIGLVPFIGDFGDFAFKANTRNLELLREYQEENER